MRSVFGCAALLALTLTPPAMAAPMADSDIKKAIIALSIGAFPANCPCPYSLTQVGSMTQATLSKAPAKRCGDNSAYRRMGEFAPVCFEDDVSPNMISRFRAVQGK